MTEFDAEKIVDDLSEEQRQKLIEKLTREPEKKKEEPFSAVNHSSRVAGNGPITTEIQKIKQEGRVTGVPVNEMPRFNRFTDDGAEHKDNQHETPDRDLTERTREPFKSIKQICTRCSKSIETHPQFHREFYICDPCLKR